MARFPYPPYEDKYFAAVGKPTINVMKMLSYSSATVDHWGTLGNAQFSKLELSKKNREFVILLSTSKFRSTYEWTFHIPLSTKMGVSDAQREELWKAGNTKGYFSDAYWRQNEGTFEQKEKLLLSFVEAVIDKGEVDDTDWQKITENFSEREIVEIISLQGFYYTFSRLTTVLKVDLDRSIKPQL